MLEVQPDVEFENLSGEGSDDDFQYEEVDVVRYEPCEDQALYFAERCIIQTTMCTSSVDDDNLIGEDLDSALRSLHNLTAKVGANHHLLTILLHGITLLLKACSL